MPQAPSQVELHLCNGSDSIQHTRIETDRASTSSKKQEHSELGISDRDGDVIRGDVEKPVKTIGHLALLSAAWKILNTWFGVGSALVLGISHGGPITLIYGMMLLSIVYGAMALSLAELSAHYPTAGGQYHWTSLLAPRRLKRGLSYSCGAANAIGRVAICAGVTIADAQFIVGIVAFNTSYTIKRWHVFVVYQAINIVNLIYNAFALHRWPWTHHVGCGLSIVSFFFITITCLAVSHPKQPSSYVWTTFNDESGWRSKPAVFMIGLISPNFGLGGLDGPLHLSEDTFDPVRTVPLAILTSIVMGCVSTVAFVVAMLYCTTDISALVSSRTGVPVFEMWFQATRSRALTNTFMALFTGVGLLTVVGSVSTASRLTWSFARDDALLWSKFVKKIDAKQQVSVNAMIYNAVWIAVLGAVYVASTTAFDSLCGTGILIEQISFAIPALLLMWRRRAARFLPRKGHYNMGVLGWAFNTITVGWTVFSIVIYCLPPYLPVIPSNMNYTCVILTVVTILALLNWRFHADKNYDGPKVYLLARRA